MKRGILIPGLLLAAIAHGQWEVPVPIALNGGAEQDRQVLGVADPVTLDAAMSLDAARNSVVTYTAVTGTAILTGDLAPAPVAYAAGMMVTIVPDAANGASAQLDLNGLGAQDILKSGSLPLDAGDMPAGAPARLIHDGTSFRLISSTYLPCPAGYHVAGRQYCIEDSARADTDYFAANRICRDLGARLCTFSEWAQACRKDPVFLTTVMDFEWVDSAANNTTSAKMVGNGSDTLGGPPMIGCQQGSYNNPSTGMVAFRCCMNR